MRTVISTDYVVTTRGGVVENRHGVHAAIVDTSGHLLYTVGDPSRLTLARSAAKPAQALAIVETGALEKFHLDDADLALICASHSSEERHIARAHNILNRIGAREEDLQCGGHIPLSKAVNRAWIKADFNPTAICSNCSGKHAGMIAGTKALGADVQTYHLPTHPMQVKVRETVDQVCGLDEDESKWGLDGCNLPAPAFPLHCLSRMYAGFAAAADELESSSSTDSRTQALSRVFNAMSRNSEFVAGDDRFCTVLMTTFEGLLIGKLGADGCYGMGVRASEQTKKLGFNGALGIAVKIEDGNIDILYSAVAEILEQLGIGEPRMRLALARFRTREIKNTVGVVTGHILAQFKVRPYER
jgi:L-asparaginase II